MARTTIRSEDITGLQVKTGDIAADAVTAAKIASGAVDTTGLEDDIALLGFKVASNGSLAKYNLVDQTVDDFQDTSGVDASASTNEIRDSSGKYYSGTSVQVEATTAFTTVETTTWTAPSLATSADYLVVAGGGGGGYGGAGDRAGGGGGGGGTRYGSLSVTGGNSYTVTVGDGGAGSTGGSTGNAAAGGNSVFSSITSNGGGGGGNGGGSGGDGGSGGGGHGGAGSGNTPSTSPSQGANGGAGGNHAGGGGGGGGATGSTGGANSGGNGGNGGAGYNGSGTSWIGTSYGVSGWFAGGGGGGFRNSQGTTSGTGGQGGGGAAGSPATAGTANTGGGGGGHSLPTNNSGNGYPGGSGTVLIHTDAISVYDNMTLVSTTTAAQAAPTKGDIVLTYTNGAGTTTLDTDLTAEISADGGSTWTALALASEGSTGSHNIATAHDVTISSTITAPYNMAYRIKTLNQSVSKTTRIQAVSLGWS